MTDYYLRNRIYITLDQQRDISSYKIFLAGAGVGSAIAEALLRMGFENMIIVDYDKVEVSNLNRQNYTSEDVGQMKVHSLRSRLLAINPNAHIKVHSVELTTDNMKGLLDDSLIAVNALDFTSTIPFEFDVLCRTIGITVIHPYNLGWGGLTYVISPTGEGIDILSTDFKHFEIKLVEFAISNLEENSKKKHWLRAVVDSYLNEDRFLPPPQLSVGSNILAAQCASLIFKIALSEPVKTFPFHYFYSIMDDI